MTTMCLDGRVAWRSKAILHASRSVSDQRARGRARDRHTCFILFGWLSDKIGRKPIMLAGFMLAVVTYFPIFQGITHFANPKLEQALTAAPVRVTADPAKCSFQFKARETEKFTTPCDIIKAALVGLSVNYENVVAPPGTVASVKIGEQTIAGDSPDAAKAIAAAIKAHGYPTAADPNDINHVMTVILLAILVSTSPWCARQAAAGRPRQFRTQYAAMASPWDWLAATESILRGARPLH
jgi:hypothetical protein